MCLPNGVAVAVFLVSYRKTPSEKRTPESRVFSMIFLRKTVNPLGFTTSFPGLSAFGEARLAAESGSHQLQLNDHGL